MQVRGTLFHLYAPELTTKQTKTLRLPALPLSSSSHHTLTHSVHAHLAKPLNRCAHLERPPHLTPHHAPYTCPNMAANGAQTGFEPVLAAHNMMQSSGNRAQKEQAHQFLEQFQKSVCWTRESNGRRG